MNKGLIHNNIVESWLDYPDGKSNCLTVYFIGCVFSCEGCHNSDFKYEKNVDDKSFVTAEDLLQLLKEKSTYHNNTNKVVFQGGDPLFPKNIDCVKDFLKINDFFDVCIYTGNEIDFIQKQRLIGFKYIKAGRFDRRLLQNSEKTDEYIQFASRNQTLYNSKIELISNEGRHYFGGNKQ